MRYQLENEVIRVEVDSFGAEVKSVKSVGDGQEYMWNGDPKYWGRTSPVLFPFVGAVRNKQYRCGESVYSMGQHGFARDMEFELERQEENRIWFVLSSDTETLSKYPFAFRLHIGYELEANELHVFWAVDNTDDKPMYFSIGAHPAFLCPVHGEADKYGYGLKFGGLSDVLHYHENTPEGLSLAGDDRLTLVDGTVKFTPGFFEKYTYVAEGKQTGEVSLLDMAGDPYVTVTFDAPLFAVWSPEGKEAPFVCIEPWYGRCDAVDFEGSISERAYEQALAAGGTFHASYSMRFDQA